MLAGAGLLELSAGADRVAFYWTPLIIAAIAIAIGAVGALNVASGSSQLVERQRPVGQPETS